MPPAPADTGHEDGCAWLAPVLWPGEHVDIRVRTPGPDDFVVAPSLSRPRLLLPSRHLPTLALTVEHAGAGHHHLWRAARRGTAAALRTMSRLTRLPLPTIGADMENQFMQPMRRAFPDAVAFGIRLGPPRPNRKPVMLVAAEDGSLVGVGKVGWSASTSAMVRTGADIPDTTDDVLIVPTTVGVHDKGDVVIHWQRALPLDLLDRHVPEQLLLDGLKAIASLRGTTVDRLAGSTYADTILELADGDEFLGTAREIMSRHADAELRFGTWHGDFTPWNAGSLQGRLAVWDWERTRSDVPVGMDALHWHLDLGRIARNPVAVPEQARQRAKRLMAGLGVDGPSVRAVSDLHLLELLLRFSTAGRRDMTMGLQQALEQRS